MSNTDVYEAATDAPTVAVVNWPTPDELRHVAVRWVRPGMSPTAVMAALTTIAIEGAVVALVAHLV
ncbi:MAG: hypothetical protein U0Q22_15075 [Acidimicrobiales bacterium]